MIKIKKTLSATLEQYAKVGSEIPDAAIEWAKGQVEASALETTCADYNVSEDIAAVLLCKLPNRVDRWLFASIPAMDNLRPIDVLRDYQRGEECIKGALLGAP